MMTFDKDEDGYLQWVAANPHGFVINAPKVGRAPYVLHKASCPDITTRFRNYTTTDYKKICSVDRQKLVDLGDRHSSDFRKCQHCEP